MQRSLEANLFYIDTKGVNYIGASHLDIIKFGEGVIFMGNH